MSVQVVGVSNCCHQELKGVVCALALKGFPGYHIITLESAFMQFDQKGDRERDRHTGILSSGIHLHIYIYTKISHNTPLGKAGKARNIPRPCERWPTQLLPKRGPRCSRKPRAQEIIWLL